MIAAAAALGAGAYYLLGPKGKEHQKKLKAMGKRVAGEVKREANKLKNEWQGVSAKAGKKVRSMAKKVKGKK
ncbi:MAG: hypothetical protein UX31_C0033G0018 [Candidatus Nomurabacteria bacterium GW2011_GWA1_46_11]|uniref:YtxH domain-containing protein n=2 Tax=Candidatus Nomuraibacteriota TaxID=1752729 RepID=A0A0G1T1V9_9BACT|nr:MAG: hypothetical protein UX31_C0033G0018 [Candidatus Nomurabacteria bacterium GW2011_GWA1_46_11]KKU75739.1 MAG: hypothetical protein UY01_C0005G0006 [Candidatus Nomurabacteria bacterium GW2011_GWB1_47_6]